MPRSEPSPADCEIIAGVEAECGIPVTVYQLERWRAGGQLPRNVAVRAGGGTASVPAPGAIGIATMLAVRARQGKAAVEDSVLDRVMLDQPVPGETLREVLLESVARVARRVGEQAAPGEAGDRDRDRAAHQSARSAVLLDVRELLALGGEAEGSAVGPDPRSVRRGVRTLARHLASPEDVASECTVRALADLGVLPEDALEKALHELRQAELHPSKELPGWISEAQSVSLDRYRQAVRGASHDALVDAVRASYRFRAMWGWYLLAAIHASPAGRSFPTISAATETQLTALAEDPALRLLGVSAGTRGGAFQAAVVLACPELGELLDLYSDRLEAVLRGAEMVGAAPSR